MCLVVYFSFIHKSLILQDDWTSSITLVAGNKLHDKAHIDMLVHAVQSEARRQFGIVNKQSLFEEVRVRGFLLQPHCKLCYTCQVFE